MKLLRLAPAIALLAACQSDGDGTARMPLSPNESLSPAASVGQVYTNSNQPGGNAILVYDRAADGSLIAAGSFPTGGTGTGAGLGNQGGVIFAGNGRYLLTANAASNDVTSFFVRPDGSLERVGRWPSGGVQPISITEHNGIAYVLNAGGAGGITGFTFDKGRLTMIAGSTRPLGGPAVGPAQVSFDASGRVLIVTQKAANSIATYTVAPSGVASGPTVIPSSGQTPFGFAVSRGLLVVTEAFGGAVDASAASSYEVRPDGTLHLLSASVPTTETAACWLAITRDGRFAYATNTGSNTITGYAISRGKLTRLDADGVSATTGGAPVDLALSKNSQFAYSLNSSGHSITGFAIGSGGDLTPVNGTISGLPAGTNGLAAR